jgi:hypothetical protein
MFQGEIERDIGLIGRVGAKHDVTVKMGSERLARDLELASRDGGIYDCLIFNLKRTNENFSLIESARRKYPRMKVFDISR